MSEVKEEMKVEQSTSKSDEPKNEVKKETKKQETSKKSETKNTSKSETKKSAPAKKSSNVTEGKRVIVDTINIYKTPNLNSEYSLFSGHLDVIGKLDETFATVEYRCMGISEIVRGFVKISDIN